MHLKHEPLPNKLASSQATIICLQQVPSQVLQNLKCKSHADSTLSHDYLQQSNAIILQEYKHIK